jgi:hypothetical protein
MPARCDIIGGMDQSKPTAKAKKSTVRHTRAIQRDRSKRPTVAPPDAQVQARLEDLVHPATYAQVALYQSLGLRERILTLPVMVALVLSVIWRHLGSVNEAVRVLNQEGLLWVKPLAVSQQAVSLRLRTFPAELFEHILQEVLPAAQQRWSQRERPLAPALLWAQQHFTAVLALDGSTLDTLLRKVGLLREDDGPVLAGRMAALLDIISRLPHQIWYEEDEHAHDQRFWERALATLAAGTLLLVDLGFLNYPVFDQLTDQGVFLLTRVKQNTAYQVERILQRTATVHDQIIHLGSSKDSSCVHSMRLVEVLYQGTWYRYLTNVLDPQVLPAMYALALYWQRWRVEDAFNVVKRLLGLAYVWVGSINGVMVQVWATWVLYAVLVDLTDAVAECLNRPFSALSMEMVFRGLYHFTQAYHRGEANDPVCYLATKAKKLGILKRPRRHSPNDLLNLTIPQDP